MIRSKASSSLLVYLFAVFVIGATPAYAAKSSIEYVAARHGGLAVRVQIVAPDEGVPIRGDILYLHGFGDRADNHKELFGKLATAGFRVLAFDFPSHGDTSGPDNDINKLGFKDLADIAATVEKKFNDSPERPLFLAGWSTGGLLAVRMVQSPAFAELSRPLAGVILYAPGVAVKPLVGKWGVITKGTLTQNGEAQMAGAIKPISPLLKPVFAAKLVVNSLLAQKEAYPNDIPTVVFMGGDHEDKYVDTVKVEHWIDKQVQAGANMIEVKVPGGYHMLDKGPEPDGDAVREVSAVFATHVADGERKVAEFGLPNLCERLLAGPK